QEWVNVGTLIRRHLEGLYVEVLNCQFTRALLINPTGILLALKAAGAEARDYEDICGACFTKDPDDDSVAGFDEVREALRRSVKNVTAPEVRQEREICLRELFDGSR